MGEKFESALSREVTNWTEVMEDPTDLDVDDYTTETYWPAYANPPIFLNASGNSSGLNKTSEENKRDEDLAKIEMAILALIFILTVLGNCVVLLGIFFRRQKMTRMYYFILHLSVADLITAFFNVLTQLFWEITYRFQGGNILCKFVKYTQILGPYSSSWVLVMTALDRYQAICYPLSNCTWTAKRSKIMLGIAWSISLLCCVPQIFIFSYQLIYDGTWECWATFPAEWVAKMYVTWYSVTVFIIPLIILVFAYGCITRAIWINFNMKAASRNHDNYEKKMTRQDSDDGEGPSTDESVFHRASSLRANASHLITTKKNNNTSLNMYAPSKYFLTSKPSTTSTSSTLEANEPKKKYRGMIGNGKATRASTTSCTTQSTTLSPNLSGRRLSPPHDDKHMSQKLFPPNGDGTVPGQQGHHHHSDGDEEQLHLIPKESDPCLIVASQGCHSSSPSPDTKSHNNIDAGSIMKNGSVKFSSGTRETCQHGCYEDRCNFCHSANHMISSASELNKDIERYHVNQGSPSPTSIEHNQSHRFQRKSSARQFFSGRSRFSRKGRGGSFNEATVRQSTKSQSMQTYVEQPRTHSVKGISRAKIKTIKLTVTIICCYIFCSSPFIAAQLWSVYDPHAHDSAFFKGPTFTILTLLASLNSCVNPYIFLFFNPNLLENCFRGIFRPKFPTRRFNNGSPLSRTLSQNRKAHYAVGGNNGGGTASNSTSGGGVGTFNRADSFGLRKPGVPVTRDVKGASSAATHLAPLISQGSTIPLGNGFSKGNHHQSHLEELSERNESGSCAAVELRDSETPYSGSSSCRVETTMMNHTSAGTSTLIS